MMSLLDEMVKLFNGGTEETPAPVPPAANASYPAVNLWEDDDYVYAEALLPGQKLSDLEITVTSNDSESHLTIKGVRRELQPMAVWHCRERGFGSFQRTIELPAPMEASQADAELDDGLLTVKMAKSPQDKPKKIRVTTEVVHPEQKA
ncbi:MAG TPA: Hsp20/alpha crystallin family protein [Gemmataceae bacterium]|nr:Hsp20/alpha crystallin family protein [Gemmataceae bacterium]